MLSRPSKKMAQRATAALVLMSVAFLYGIGALGMTAIVNGEENRLDRKSVV